MRRGWLGTIGGALAAATVLAVPMSAGAATAGASFKFSGGEKGSLKVPSCTINALGSQFDLHGKLSHRNASWVLTVDVSKPGTYKHFAVNGPIGSTSISLEQNGRIWEATSGTMTMGTTSGSLNVTMKPEDPGAGSRNVKVSGSWSGCNS